MPESLQLMVRYLSSYNYTYYINDIISKKLSNFFFLDNQFRASDRN